MKEFIDFILQFGNLNQQQIDLISKKAKESLLRKEEYFAEAGKIMKQVGFVIDGIILFSTQDWKEISDTIVGWENIVQKIVSKALVQKLERVTPLVSQDATTRDLEFMEKYPTLVNRIPMSYIASYLGIT
ncbi:Crp/Fnr family transcriptional regulator [Sinomicrobium sp. M5D2P17]